MKIFLVALVLALGVSSSHVTLHSYSDEFTSLTWAARGGITVSIDAEAGSTTGYIFLELDTDLSDNETFVAHIHDAACSDGNGGAHWQADSSGPVDTTNEFWFEFAGEGDGTGTQTVWYKSVENLNFAVDSGAVSVVVHENDGTRALCADLTLVTEGDYDLIMENTLTEDFTSIAGDQNASGFARVFASETETISVFAFTTEPGYNTTEGAFTAHIHDAPCDDNNGGGHWQVDSTGPVDTTNEFWYEFTETDLGLETTFALAVVNSNFGASPFTDESFNGAGEGSIVVHEAGGARSICTNMALVDEDDDDDDDSSVFAAVSMLVVVLVAMLY
jgi:hypothetical protein